MSTAAALSQPDLAALAHHNLLCYAMAQWSGYSPANHHRLIADALHRVVRGECKRLMIFTPPRAGKSMLVSEYFPPWFFGHRPDAQVIHATYGQDLADGFGRKVRNQFAGEIFRATFPGVGLAPDSAAASRFATTARGEYHAVGVGGPATGKGADLLLIDDPIRSREDADSPVMRAKLWDWYTSVAYTRLMPGGAIVLVQTRWHMDDLAGRILSEHGHEGWEVLSLPALNDRGEALWPERYPVSTLDQIRLTIGPRDWSALYMQSPTATGGGEFLRSWLKYYVHHNPKGDTIYILVDPAGARKGISGRYDSSSTRDYTAIWVVGLSEDGNFYALDVFRDRFNLIDRANLLFRLHRKYRPLAVVYERYGLESDIDHLNDKMERENYRFNLVEVAGSLKKEDRIRRLIPLFANGQIWLPERLDKTGTDGKTVDVIDTFIEQEYAAFPAGKHDDMIDALSRLLDIDLLWPAGKYGEHAAVNPLPEWAYDL